MNEVHLWDFLMSGPVYPRLVMTSSALPVCHVTAPVCFSAHAAHPWFGGERNQLPIGVARLSIFTMQLKGQI